RRNAHESLQVVERALVPRPCRGANGLLEVVLLVGHVRLPSVVAKPHAPVGAGDQFTLSLEPRTATCYCPGRDARSAVAPACGSPFASTTAFARSLRSASCAARNSRVAAWTSS